MRLWLPTLVAVVVALPHATLTGSARSGFGNTVLVGSGEIFVGEATNQSRPGRVYVYRKVGGLWQEDAILEAPAPAVNDRFGRRLSLDADRLAVSAGNTIHVFQKDGGMWKHAAAISTSLVPGPDVRFGGALAISGDWVWAARPSVPRPGQGIFAAKPNPDAPPPAVGAVYAFQRGVSGSFEYRATITPSTSQPADNFGTSIAIDGSVVLIGAPGHAEGTGLVYEFARDKSGGLIEQRSVAPPGLQRNEAFGAEIAIRGSLVIVGAPDQGRIYPSAYVYRRAAQGTEDYEIAVSIDAFLGDPKKAKAPGNVAWRELGRLTPPVGARFDGFGTTMSMSERELWVGAWAAGETGRAFVFPYAASGFQPDGLKVITPPGEQGMQAGASVSVRDNVAAIGAPGTDSSMGGLLIYERDEFGTWRLVQPIVTPPLDEIPSFTGAERRCPAGGKVEVFDCGAVNLLSFLPPSKLSHDGRYAEISSLWGWTDAETGREWAILGRATGATFIDITKPTAPVVVADLPPTPKARPSSWREIKVYKDHAFIVSDGSGPHGVQIFDLRRLRTMQPQPNGRPRRVEADTVYSNVASVHNIAVNEESGFAYAVGANGGGTTCGGGLHMIDVRDPKKPSFAGCYADTGSGLAKTGYSHDVQCVIYNGPDARYARKEICIGSNESAISIADVTDKAKPRFVSRGSYPTSAYIHQGWFDESRRYFYVNDEGDEMNGTAKKTRTLIWDLADLENPRLVKEHLGLHGAIDHNLYIKGQLMYQANYTSGLRILSIKDPVNPREIGFFDTAPYHDNNAASFNGAWNVFPFFKSGTIIVSSIEQGLFVLRTADR